MTDHTTLSETESKSLLSTYGVPIAGERIVGDAEGAATAAAELGFPVVAKLNGERIAHKTERGLVRLHLDDAEAVRSAAAELLAAATPDDGDVSILIAPMVAGNRELIAGLVRDPQFGPTVMIGMGGVLAEAIEDVAFGPAPLDRRVAHEMLNALSSQTLLGEFRGDAAVDREAVVDVLVGLSALVTERPEIRSVDINPLIVGPDGRLTAVDALVELGEPDTTTQHRAVGPLSREHFLAMFEPRGVVVTGASTHPGKFGFVALHNLLVSGYEGAVAATNLKRESVLGIQTVASLDEVATDTYDLVFVCTPAATNVEVLQQAASKGIRAAFITSAGYGESDESGVVAQAELVQAARDLDILLAGPNGQGVVSTPAHLCAQIVAPYPVAGSIGVASQSGNFVSSFLNLANASGVGISRAVSAGNAAAVGVADFLTFYADDDATTVCLAYIEGIQDGRYLMEQLGDVARRKPLVVLKGGATQGGAAAAASHTGALASDDKVFDGECRARGITRAASVEEAFEAAATFATQPIPPGGRVAVLTTAGGWGVVTADAITRHPELELAQLPTELVAAIDDELPARWSRANPVDCAGGETRDTIPVVMELLARSEAVDAIIYLGIGIQSNQARMMRDGRFYPGDGLERIVDYHERQDRRFAEAAAELSERWNKPILVATELAFADRSNAGPAGVADTGRVCYSSGDRAVTALGHLVRYGRDHQSVMRS